MMLLEVTATLSQQAEQPPLLKSSPVNLQSRVNFYESLLRILHIQCNELRQLKESLQASGKPLTENETHQSLCLPENIREMAQKARTVWDAIHADPYFLPDNWQEVPCNDLAEMGLGEFFWLKRIAPW